MKVFQVITGRNLEDAPTCRYVTQEDNLLEKVAAHFETYCLQHGEQLIEVRYLCTIAEHIE